MVAEVEEAEKEMKKHLNLRGEAIDEAEQLLSESRPSAVKVKSCCERLRRHRDGFSAACKAHTEACAKADEVQPRPRPSQSAQCMPVGPRPSDVDADFDWQQQFSAASAAGFESLLQHELFQAKTELANVRSSIATHKLALVTRQLSEPLRAVSWVSFDALPNSGHDSERGVRYSESAMSVWNKI